MRTFLLLLAVALLGAAVLPSEPPRCLPYSVTHPCTTRSLNTRNTHN